jgi:hypothetical protein
MVFVAAIVVFAAIATNSLTSFICLARMAMIILIAGRSDLRVRSRIVAVLGIALYACIPLVVEVVRSIPPFGPGNSINELVQRLPMQQLTGRANEVVQQFPMQRLTGREDSSVMERLESLRGDFIYGSIILG